MIVRLMGEGQWRLDAAVLDELNAIDALLDADLDSAGAADFTAHLAAMHDLVRTKGTPVPEDELVPSDALVPPVNITLDELSGLLGEEGLIPG